jgi:Transposase, Mutator family
MDEAETDVLAYVAFPPTHRAKPHSVSTLERLNSLPSGRSAGPWGRDQAVHRPGRHFPNVAAITRLVGASGTPATPPSACQPWPPDQSGPAGHRGDQRQLHHAGAILVRTASVPNRVVRSLLTSLERSTFEPAAQLASHNPLIWRASHNRTKWSWFGCVRERGEER